MKSYHPKANQLIEVGFYYFFVWSSLDSTNNKINNSFSINYFCSKPLLSYKIVGKDMSEI